MPPNAIIFDCDGTLVDSEPLAAGLLAECAAEHGAQMSAAEAMTEFTGHRMADCLRVLESRLGRALPPSFEADYRGRLSELFREALRPMEGARELLQAIDVPFCVASSGPREKIELSLGLTDLRSYFGDLVFSAYDLGAWKPDPALFLHAARAMGVAPEGCLVVEDSRPGIDAGVAAGMRVLAFRPTGRALPLPQGVEAIQDLSAVLAVR